MNPNLTIHPLAERFPEMPAKDFEELKESIRKHGLFEPIIHNDAGQILDGRHRYKALMELGDTSPGGTSNFGDVQTARKPMTEAAFIFESNIHRRHLTDDQRVMLAAEFAPFFRKEGEERKAEALIPGPKPKSFVDLNSGPRDIGTKHANSTVGKVAAKVGVSEYKAAQAIKVVQDPELSKQVTRGEVTLKDAVEIIRPEKPWTKHRPVGFLDLPTPPMSRDAKMIRLFKNWVRNVCKEKEITRKELIPIILKFTSDEWGYRLEE